MEEIYNELNRFLKGSTRLGINETIARYVMGHLDQIPDLKLVDLAAQCNTSTPSVIRFCREIGYEDYTDFKNAVREYWQDVEEGYVDLSSFIDLKDEDSYKRSVEEWVAHLNKTTKEALLTVDRRKAGDLARDIMDYRYVYLIGTGIAGIICELLRISLARIGILLVNLSIPMMDYPLSDDKNDTLCVVISQHGRLLKDNPDLIEYLENNSRKVWFVTQDSRDIFRFRRTQILRLNDTPSHEVQYHIMLSFVELIREICQSLKDH